MVQTENLKKTAWPILKKFFLVIILNRIRSNGSIDLRKVLRRSNRHKLYCYKINDEIRSESFLPPIRLRSNMFLYIFLLNAFFKQTFESAIKNCHVSCINTIKMYPCFQCMLACVAEEKGMVSYIYINNDRARPNFY